MVALQLSADWACYSRRLCGHSRGSKTLAKSRLVPGSIPGQSHYGYSDKQNNFMGLVF